MKRILFNILFFLFSVFSIFSMTSCGTMTATAQYDNTYAATDNIDIDVRVIFRYGTPYYYNGMLNYYAYDGIYWYPFWYDNMWYFRPYRRPYKLGYIPPYRGWRPPVHYRGWHAGRHGFDRPTGRYNGMPYRKGYHGNTYNSRKSWSGQSELTAPNNGTFGNGRRFGQGSTENVKPQRQSTNPNRGTFGNGRRFGQGSTGTTTQQRQSTNPNTNRSGGHFGNGRR